MKFLQDQAFYGEPRLLQISWFFLLSQVPARMILLQRPKINSQLRSEDEITNKCESNHQCNMIHSVIINLIINNNLKFDPLTAQITRIAFLKNHTVMSIHNHEAITIRNWNSNYYETRISEPIFPYVRKDSFKELDCWLCIPPSRWKCCKLQLGLLEQKPDR